MENISEFTNTGMEALITSLKSYDAATKQRCLRIIDKTHRDVEDMIREMKESQSARLSDGYLPDDAADFDGILEGILKDMNANLEQLSGVVNTKINTMMCEISGTDIHNVDMQCLKENGYGVCKQVEE